MPTFQELKRKTLEQRRDALAEQYTLAAGQLENTLNAADKPRLRRQMTDLEQEIVQLETELAALGTPPKATEDISPPLNTAPVGRAEARKQLQKVLADLYPDPDDAKRIIADAGLNLALIKLGGSAINMWFNIVDHAEKVQQIPALLACVAAEYGANAEFQQLRQSYLNTLAH